MIRSPIRAHDRERFYKYTDLATARLILGNRRLRWSSPLLFNDPFDVPRDATFAFTPDELHDAVVDEISDIVRHGSPKAAKPFSDLYQFAKNLDPVRAEKMLAMMKMFAATRKPVAPAHLNDFAEAWRELVPGLRILCLSATPVSVPMWAYYADRHRGVVLEFHCRDDLDPATLLARPVVYASAAPVLPGKDVWAKVAAGVEDFSSELFFAEYHYHKSTDWQHEQEWRIISYARPGDNGLYSDMGFRAQELQAIYLGAEAGDDANAAITAALVGDLQHVRVGKAVPDFSSRHLTLQLAASAAT